MAQGLGKAPLFGVCLKHFEKIYLWINLLIYVAFSIVTIRTTFQTSTKWAFLLTVGMALTCLALMFFSIRDQRNNTQHKTANSLLANPLQIQSWSNMPELLLAKMRIAPQNESLSSGNKRVAKKDLIDYFKALLDFYGKYHNHKEISAWGCLVLYVGFCAVAVKTPLPNPGQKAIFGAVAVAFACVAFLIFLYIQNQLRLKDVGGAYALACLFFLTEITATADESLNPQKYIGLPGSSSANFQSDHALSSPFKQKSEELKKHGQRGQQMTRWLMYGPLWITTVIVLGIKFLETFSHSAASGG